MGKPNDLVWDQVCFGASLFDPLGRAFQLPGLRKTFRRPAENSPVSVVPHPQKLPAKASAQAPVASLPSELLAIIAAQHLCADLDFARRWPEFLRRRGNFSCSTASVPRSCSLTSASS